MQDRQLAAPFFRGSSRGIFVTNSTQPIVVRTEVSTSCSTVRLQHQTRRHRLENVRGEEAGTETGGKPLWALGISQLNAVRASGDGQRVNWTACFVSAGPTRVCQPQRGRRLPRERPWSRLPVPPPGQTGHFQQGRDGAGKRQLEKENRGPQLALPLRRDIYSCRPRAPACRRVQPAFRARRSCADRRLRHEPPSGTGRPARRQLPRRAGSALPSSCRVTRRGAKNMLELCLIILSV